MRLLHDEFRCSMSESYSWTWKSRKRAHIRAVIESNTLFTPQKCITKRISNQYKTSLISFQHWFFKFDSAFSTFVLYSAETTHPIFLK